MKEYFLIIFFYLGHMQNTYVKHFSLTIKKCFLMIPMMLSAILIWMNHRMLKGAGSRNIKLEKKLKIDKNLYNVI